jgi:hypothetical protein
MPGSGAQLVVAQVGRRPGRSEAGGARAPAVTALVHVAPQRSPGSDAGESGAGGERSAADHQNPRPHRQPSSFSESLLVGMPGSSAWHASWAGRKSGSCLKLPSGPSSWMMYRPSSSNCGLGTSTPWSRMH